MTVSLFFPSFGLNPVNPNKTKFRNFAKENSEILQEFGNGMFCRCPRGLTQQIKRCEDCCVGLEADPNLDSNTDNHLDLKFWVQNENYFSLLRDPCFQPPPPARWCCWWWWWWLGPIFSWFQLLWNRSIMYVPMCCKPGTISSLFIEVVPLRSPPSQNWRPLMIHFCLPVFFIFLSPPPSFMCFVK